MTDGPLVFKDSADASVAAATGDGLVSVALPLPLGKTYAYRAPAGAARGAFVRAPFGPQRLIGVVWGAAPDDGFPAEKARPIDAVLEAPRVAADVLDFLDWTAAYTMTPLGGVLRLMLRSGEYLTPPAGASVCALGSGDAEIRMTPKRQAALDAAAAGAISPADLAARAGVSSGVVRGLIAAGALIETPVDPDPPFLPPDLSLPGCVLSAEQATAAAAIIARIAAGASPPILLDGVTGSGKTEVYLEAIAAALRRDGAAQVLILLPEIALTIPFLARVEERFGAPPAAWHSDMTQAARRRVWRRVADGSARLVIGARSALFLPFQRLRFIVVDEEHDGAYKQEEGVIYQARDLAVARAKLGRFPIVLASATPSIETVVNVDQGRYDVVRLPARYGRARLPEIAAVDLRATPPSPGAWLAQPVVEGVDAALQSGGQALLFLNRRGYAPLTICRRCGHRMKAPDSDTWLVEHRFENRLVCHHTGYSMPKPEACPECGAVGGLAACGPGVERVAEEAAARWPAARQAVLSSDLSGPQQIRTTIAAMKAGEIDLLVATQIVAKGHTFPNLVFVGVVDADMGLSGGDLRAAERTYQLLTQVAGRAGRAERPGRALLQTYQPEAAVMRALAGGDRDDFLVAEAESRQALGFPPFGRLAAIILRARDEKLLVETAHAHRRAAPLADGAVLWGPAPAPIYRLRGEIRMRFLLKTRRDFNLQAYLAAWLDGVKLPAAIRRTIDIDPYTFL